MTAAAAAAAAATETETETKSLVQSGGCNIEEPILHSTFILIPTWDGTRSDPAAPARTMTAVRNPYFDVLLFLRCCT